MSELHVVYGAGPLGRSVMEELVRQGKTVRVVSRPGRWPRRRRGSSWLQVTCTTRPSCAD